MKPLVAMEAMRHPVLGVESFTSYLRRLATLYSVSLHQMLRYLCESEEISSLVGEAPFRMSFNTPTTLSGYVGSVGNLIKRVAVATGVQNVAATTLLRIGPSLTPIATGSIVTKRRYCGMCASEMRVDDEQPLWEPLIWSLATVGRCPLHGRFLDQAGHQWKSFDSLHIAPGTVRLRRGTVPHLEQWRIAETSSLIDYCSTEPMALTVENAPTVFIAEFMAQHRLSVLEFAKRTGFGYTSIERKLGGAQKTSLTSVFSLAQRLAMSPIDILSDPISTARQTSLFDFSGDIDRYPENRKKAHPAVTRDLLVSDLRRLLASSSALPPLELVCRARGVSTGFARHSMPGEVSSYTIRRFGEIGERRNRCHERARRLAEEALTDPDDPDAILSMKRTEKKLRAVSGMPKHVLQQALIETRRNLAAVAERASL